MKRILRNDKHTVDEIVVTDCTIHMEQMGDDSYWIGVTVDDVVLHINLVARCWPRRLEVWVQNDPGWEWDEDRTHWEREDV